MRKVRIAVLSLLLLAAALVPSVFADGVVREEQPTVVGIAAGSDDFDTLVAAVTAAGLVDTLSGEGPFTVFAPTDAAFDKLPAGTVQALLADPAALTSVLTYHVLAGDVGSDIAISKAANPEGVTTLNGEQLRLKVFDGSLYLNDDTLVTTADILASNGKVHVIDTVLIPPSMQADMEMAAASTAAPAVSTGNTIVDVAVADGRFDTLVTAVTAAGLAGTLSGEGPFTVFAPTDDAFAKLPASTINSLLADPSGALTDILLFHVLDGAVSSADAIAVAAGSGSTTALSGDDLRLKVVDGVLYVDENSAVIIQDIVTSNGVIHVIDTVMIPGDEDMSSSSASSVAAASGDTIVDIAAADGRFDTLVAAVTAAGLAGTLSGEGPFTVFAPTDDAFAKLPAGTVPTLLADPSGALTDILLFHVVDGAVSSTDAIAVAAGSGSTTALSGDELRLKVFEDTLYVDENSAVIIPDIVASNGVIHVIDTVMLPGDEAGDSMAASTSSSSDMGGNTIVDIAVNDGRFDTLVAAVTAAGLAGTLSGEGPFTVFAPTDDAFAKLPSGTVQALLADPSGALTDILLFHVVDGAVSSADAISVAAGSGETTALSGDTLRIKVVDGSVYVDENSQVIIADLVASNGVIHVIDTVMIPGDEATE